MEALTQELRLDIAPALAAIEDLETALLEVQRRAAAVNTAIQAIGTED